MVYKELYSNKFGFKFYHIPRNAMTSVIKSYNLEWTDISLIPKDAATIAILRDPIERLISGISHVKGSAPRKKHYNANNIIDKIIQCRYRYMSGKKTHGPLGFYNSHLAPQIYFLNLYEYESVYGYNIKRNIVDVDIFIDHGSLNYDIEKKLGLKADIFHINQNKSKSRYEEYKSVILERISDVLWLYSEDFELYKNKIIK